MVKYPETTLDILVHVLSLARLAAQQETSTQPELSLSCHQEDVFMLRDGLVLLVGNDHDLGTTLANEGYQLLRADSGAEAMGLIGRIVPDLVLLDFDLPGMGPIETLEALRQGPHTQRVGVVCLGDVPGDLARAFAAGADEFLISVPEPGELLARVDHLIAKKRELDTLYFLATHDGLTGALNRKAFLEAVDGALTHRAGRALSVVMFDLDHFKIINDTQGHGAGDAALRHVADLFDHHTRGSDILGRLGGEEFAFLLPETDLMGALTAARRLRSLLEVNPVPFSDLFLSASFGASSAIKDDLPGSLLARSDQALYHAKEAGRNLVAFERDGVLGLCER